MPEKKPGLTVAELNKRLKGTGWKWAVRSDGSYRAEKRVKPDRHAHDEILVVRDSEAEARLRLAEMVAKLESKEQTPCESSGVS